MHTLTSAQLLRRWLEENPGAAVIPLSCRSPEALSEMGLTRRSVLGALLDTCGGILCAGRQLRLLGGENAAGASLYALNEVKNGRPTLLPGALAVGQDAGGGIFALNCGLLAQAPPGEVLYLPGDSPRWERLGMGHADFVCWALHISTQDWQAGGWGSRPGGLPPLSQADVQLRGKLALCRAMNGGEQANEAGV